LDSFGLVLKKKIEINLDFPHLDNPYRKIGGTACTGVRLRVDQSAGDAKITEFNDALLVDENVGGLDVPMDHGVVHF